MESLTPHSDFLRNLQLQVKKLAADSLSLADLFTQEANRMNRQDEASRLKVLRSSINQQLEPAKSLEITASSGHSKAKLVTSLTGLAVGIGIQMASENKRVLAFSNHLLKNLGGKELPFGTVFISIGPKGLPDDVQVISISELARESNRDESEVISELQERGHLLFGEEAFSRLIDRLTADVLAGRLLLPVPIEKLTEIPTVSWVKFEPKKLRWITHSEPPQNLPPSS